VIDVSEEHCKKASSSIVVSESGSVIDVSEEHCRKASPSIVVSESGSVMNVSEEHFQKVLHPILFAPAGTTMDTILSRSTPFGRTTLPSFRRTASQRMFGSEEDSVDRSLMVDMMGDRRTWKPHTSNG
jgi:hypothetical protein